MTETVRMTLDEYQSLAGQTAAYDENGPDPLLYLAGKLAAEGGEANQVILKKVFHGFPADDGEADRMLKKELGDVLWYLSETARCKGWKLSEVASANLVKIAERKSMGILAGSGDDRELG